MESQYIGCYKGTAFTALAGDVSTIKNEAHDMIVRRLRDGLSINEQKALYKGPLDFIEGRIVELNGGNMLPENHVGQLAQYGFGNAVDKLATIWNLNIAESYQ